MKIKNKKGAEKIISVYWFAILVLVAGTIVYMVSTFYGDPYDIRGIESNIMINKIADCLSENGKLNSKINQNNFLEECNLNFGNDKDEYYVEVEFYYFENYNSENKEPFFNIVKGNINLKSFGEIASASNSIFKSEKSFYVLNENNEELIIKITSIIRKTEKNVG